MMYGKRSYGNVQYLFKFVTSNFIYHVSICIETYYSEIINKQIFKILNYYAEKRERYEFYI
jgi:DNA topoisomerase IB